MAKTGRFDKAQGILEQCRTLPDHQAILQEMQEIKESIRFEAKAAASTYYTMLFKDELHTRRRILLGGGVQVLQKLTGIDFIATNAPQMFALGGSTGDKLALLAGGSFISSTASMALASARDTGFFDRRRSDQHDHSVPHFGRQLLDLYHIRNHQPLDAHAHLPFLYR